MSKLTFNSGCQLPIFQGSSMHDCASCNHLPASRQKLPHTDLLLSLIPPLSCSGCCIKIRTGPLSPGCGSSLLLICQKDICLHTQDLSIHTLQVLLHFVLCSSPFPVSEARLLVCYLHLFLPANSFLLKQDKSSRCQVILGLPEPRHFSFLPRLKLVQSGIQHTHLENCQSNSCIRLPITPEILLKLCTHWSQLGSSPKWVLLWAAVSMCFFGFFSRGR